MLTETLDPTTPSAALPLAWDLETLLAGRSVDELLAMAERTATDLLDYRGRVGALDASELALLFRRLATVGETLGRVSSYAGLRHWAATEDHESAALMQRVEEESTAITSQLAFVELEWAQVPAERAEELLSDEQLSFCAYYLECLREYGPHHLTEEGERVDAERSLTGIHAWVRLFEELEAAIECPMLVGGEVRRLSLEEAVSMLASPDRQIRLATHAAITQGLAAGLETRAFIYNTVMLDREATDRLRGFSAWMSEWNAENEMTDEQTDALLQAVRSRYTTVQRWYRLKAAMLGHPLSDCDRYASLDTTDDPVSFEEGAQIVLEAFAAFHPRFAEIARRFINERWIDVPIRPGKVGGAFCDYTVSSHHPYVLLNWTGRRADVLTLAHELGHGIHAYLSAGQGHYHQQTAMPLAETASVFAETITLAHLLATTKEPRARLALLVGQVDDAVNTVFRQAALFSFEDLAHRTRREEGELSVEEINDIWLTTQREMFGDSVEVSDDYGSWWSYIGHFFASPGYVSSYPFGQLLALSVYARCQEDPTGFPEKLMAMLSAGGSRPSDELAAMVNCDLDDPQFWYRGLDIIDVMVSAAEEAARAAGIIPEVGP